MSALKIDKKILAAAITAASLAPVIAMEDGVGAGEALTRACVKVSEIAGLTAEEQKLLVPYVQAVLGASTEAPELREHLTGGAVKMAVSAHFG